MQRGKFEINLEQLYLDAKTSGAAEKLEDELYSFSKLVQDNYDFKLFLEDPRIAADYKKKKLKEICPKETTNNFFATMNILIDHGREEQLEILSRAFCKQFAKDNNMLFGEVLSVCEMPKKSRDRLLLVMERIERKKVRLRYAIDAELLGGLSVKLINGEVWDVSLRHKLDELKATILEQ